MKSRRKKSISYSKWGYIFIAPFFVIYLLCTFVPQILTIYNSFFENYMSGLSKIGPNFVGFDNYVKLFTPDSSGTIDIFKFAGNTLIMWVIGAVPQIIVALLLAIFFTSRRLNIKCQPFFKTVMYMPNLIMASAFSMLFFSIFSNVGPVNQLIMAAGGEGAVAFDFFGKTVSVRMLVALMNFIMWFGNTMIMLMAGIMGIDQSLFESAQIDGANSVQAFFKITFPLLMPIIVYVVITALIGGLQMFDVPQVLTNGQGVPNRTSMTLVMQINNYLTPSMNFGMSGAASVILFVISGLLSGIVYKSLSRQYTKGDTKIKKNRKGIGGMI